MSNEKVNSRDVALLLESTAARAFKMQMDEVVPVLDEAEASCLSMVLSKEQQLEIKRRVAEWKMRLLCDRNAPFEIVELLHNNIVELGYTNLEIEGSMEIYYAQYCERQGKTDDVRQTLLQLRAKLDGVLTTTDLDVYRHFREVSDDILSRIDTGS